jgi:hypothetical protein
MIRVTPIYGNGWFGPTIPGHIEVPAPFIAEDISDEDGKVLSVISAGSDFAGMVMQRSKSFSDSPDDYVPYSVSLYGPDSLSGKRLKRDIRAEYQGYVLINEVNKHREGPR